MGRYVPFTTYILSEIHQEPNWIGFVQLWSLLDAANCLGADRVQVFQPDIHLTRTISYSYGKISLFDNCSQGKR